MLRFLFYYVFGKGGEKSEEKEGVVNIRAVGEVKVEPV
jgi:hypothetical protein